MTDEQRSAADLVTEQVKEIVDRTGSAPTSADPHPAREPLDREQREIKDSVLRMGIMVEDAIRAAIKALERSRRRRRAGGDRRATAGSTRRSARPRA